ncbi:MAG: shikimate kinase [Candidatus Eremiobacterota bacterium]
MNIILTGFMGSGKSTCGKMLSDITGMKFIDTDKLIEEKTGFTVTEIFTRYGEKRFREIESNIIEKVSDMDGCVIATGGGAVLSSQNTENLRKNGKIIYLRISYDKAMERTGENIETRPLVHKGKDIKKIYNDRQELYKNNDFEINADRELSEVVRTLKEILEISQ